MTQTQTYKSPRKSQRARDRARDNAYEAVVEMYAAKTAEARRRADARLARITRTLAAIDEELAA